MRIVAVYIWLLMLLGAVIAIFWYNDYRYSLPTPVPPNYHNVKVNTKIDLSAVKLKDTSKPVFLHFFNPDCPCSRFNIKHFKLLVKNYGSRVNFVVVLMTKKNYSKEDINAKYDFDVPLVFNTKLAASCGVYSTPQAVILNSARRLYYRGNYNSSRYCSDPKTAYAKNALEELLRKDAFAFINPLALKSYGCSLPDCNK